jgi:hypothetical protein
VITCSSKARVRWGLGIFGMHTLYELLLVFVVVEVLVVVVVVVVVLVDVVEIEDNVEFIIIELFKLLVIDVDEWMPLPTVVPHPLLYILVLFDDVDVLDDEHEVDVDDDKRRWLRFSPIEDDVWLW